MTFKRKEIEYITNENGCHICTSHSKNNDGYCKTKINGLNTTVHRYLYQKNFGQIPESIIIRHKCDTRDCINLDHLESGTHQDNTNDKMERGRHVSGLSDSKGELNPRAVLTEEDIREIRADMTNTNVALAKVYGVTHSMISAIRLRKNWKHII